MTKYRVLVDHEVYQKNAAGELAMKPKGTVMELPPMLARQLLDRGSVELVVKREAEAS